MGTEVTRPLSRADAFDEHVHTADCLDGCDLLVDEAQPAPAAEPPSSLLQRVRTRPALLVPLALAGVLLAGAGLSSLRTSGSEAPEIAAPPPAAPVEAEPLPATAPEPATQADEAAPAGEFGDWRDTLVDALADEPVPDLVGMSLNEARMEVLRSKLAFDALPADGEHRVVVPWKSWVVVGQEPKAGTAVAPGSVVRLLVLLESEVSR